MRLIIKNTDGKIDIDEQIHCVEVNNAASEVCYRIRVDSMNNCADICKGDVITIEV